MTFRVMPAPPQTIISWWDESSDLDLSPVYQRKGEVWTVKQNQDLVDTILNSFDIPKLYFADFTLLDSSLNSKRKKFAVIDGKQRMLAIFGFFEGSFTLSRKFVLFESPELRLGGLSYDDLVSNYPKIARRFANYSLSVMSVVTDDEQKINELFIRLNSSKPLVGAEIRNAMIGEVPQLIREIVETDFWMKTRFSKQRGQDKNLAAKLLLLEHAGTFVDTKKRQLDDLVIKTNDAADAAELLRDEQLLEDPHDSQDEELEGEVITAEDVADAAESSENSDISRSADRVKRMLAQLSPRFVPNDPVLGQQAQIPVIYWLARESEPHAISRLREFLVMFEGDRIANRQREIGDPDRDMTLIDFELMARTSNDQSSIAGRYRIMRERFDRFLAAPSA